MIFVVIINMESINGNLLADLPASLYFLRLFLWKMSLFEKPVNTASVQPCGLLRKCFTLKNLE